MFHLIFALLITLLCYLLPASATPASASTQEETPETLFLTWLINHGADISPTITWPTPHSTQIRLMTVNQDIPARSPLFAIPSHLIFTASTVPATHPAMQVPRLWLEQHKDDEVMMKWYRKIDLACLLIQERLKGQQSRFAPYINVLPATAQAAGTLVYWTNEEIAELHDLDLARAVYSLRKEHDAIYERFLAEEVAQQAKQEYTRELWDWAQAIVSTRTHSFEKFQLERFGHLGLVPLLDMMNHVHGELVVQGLAPSMKPQTPYMYHIQSIRAMKTGEEVANMYGHFGDDKLLLSYGFAIDRNPHTVARLQLPEPKHELRRTVLAMKEFDVKNPTELTFIRAPDHVVRFFRLLGSKISVDLQNTTDFILRAHMGPIRFSNEIWAHRGCAQLISVALSRFSTTMEQDEEELATVVNDPDQRRKLYALRYRVQIKRIMNRSLEYCIHMAQLISNMEEDAKATDLRMTGEMLQTRFNQRRKEALQTIYGYSSGPQKEQEQQWRDAIDQEVREEL